MSQQITISQIPSQSFTVDAGGSKWAFELVSISVGMVANIDRDGVRILTGQRIMPNQPLIPYSYLSGSGNFVWISQQDAYPLYTEIGISQFLEFVSLEEIEAANV